MVGTRAMVARISVHARLALVWVRLRVRVRARVGVRAKVGVRARGGVEARARARLDEGGDGG